MMTSSENRLEEKVMELQTAFKQFRAEVDMKMSIMRQVLSTRNDQFTVEKKLLDREQSFYQAILDHWENSASLVSSGYSINFTTTDADADADDEGQMEVCSKDQAPFSMSKPVVVSDLAPNSLGSSKRKRRRVRSKVKPEPAGADSESNPDDIDIHHDIPLDDESVNVGSDSNDQTVNAETAEGDGTVERRVFVNYYSEHAPTGCIFTTKTPVWQYFLREESTGESALCKLCDTQGVQTILSVKRGQGNSTLHKHIQAKHGLNVGSVYVRRSRGGSRGKMDSSHDNSSSGSKSQHNKLLFQGRWHCLDNKSSTTGKQSWRCSQYWATRCRGRLTVRGDGEDPILNNQHTCEPAEEEETKQSNCSADSPPNVNERT